MTIALIDYEVCTACGACIEFCPMDIFRERGDGFPVIRYPEDCQCCYLCELKCAAGALLVLPERAFPPTVVYAGWGPEETKTPNRSAQPIITDGRC